MPSVAIAETSHSSAKPSVGDAASAFLTAISGQPRTGGVSVDRRGTRGGWLEGLDVEQLAVIASSAPGTTARGKLVVVADHGVTVFQTSPKAGAEPAWCVNGTATVSALLNQSRVAFDLFGPEGRVVRVAQTFDGRRVAQTWTISDFTMSEHEWRDRLVVRCDGLNPYAIVLGSLPDQVTPEQARHELVGSGLTAKLAVLTATTAGGHVTFTNAGGRHGAAPPSGLAAIAVAALRSSNIGAFVSNGTVAYTTNAGIVREPLPLVAPRPDGTIAIAMSAIDVRLTPIDRSRP